MNLSLLLPITIVVSVKFHINRWTAAGTREYHKEAWVAIYNATDGEPKTSNLVGQYLDGIGYPGNKPICDGKAAKHVNRHHHPSAELFGFDLTDAELSEKLRTV